MACDERCVLPSAAEVRASRPDLLQGCVDGVCDIWGGLRCPHAPLRSLVKLKIDRESSAGHEEGAAGETADRAALFDIAVNEAELHS